METIKGFVESIRDLNKVQFVVITASVSLGDRIQCTLQKNEDNARLNAIVSSLTRESAIEVHGQIVSNPNVKLYGYELLISDIIVHSVSAGQMPVDDLSNENTRADWRFLELRKKIGRAHV